MNEAFMDFDGTFSSYQKGTGDTAVYPEANTGSAMALAYVGLGLGEVGELQGKIKKVLRDDGGILSSDKRDAMLDELGDVLWYAARLADELNIDLGYVAVRNLAKLASRKERGVLQGSGDNR
jgi:NTP pyrophosphatase (non-canonical NTP hydrolase)